jgi:hypothetical protein
VELWSVTGISSDLAASSQVRARTADGSAAISGRRNRLGKYSIRRYWR